MSKIDQLRHAETGDPLNDFVLLYPNELDQDAVGIWQIVPDAEHAFGLSGDDLFEYVRRAVVALLDAGAVPVKFEDGSGYEWTHQKQYGVASDEISEAVVAELARVPLPWDSYALIEHCPWFARPNPKYPKYVKMD